MSILIKGMKMPKNCWECFAETELGAYIAVFGACCPFGERIVLPKEFNAKAGIHPSCPMVEVPTPHGHLIDGEVLWDELRYGHDVDLSELPETLAALLEMIDSQDTIIEAEEE